MNKKFILIFTLIIIMSSLVVFANGNIKLKYEAYESYAKIFLNYKEIKFDLPITVINGHTYVPLKETVEKSNLDIRYSEKEHKIILTKNSYDFDIYKVFESLFEFKLSDRAEILYYDYVVQNEEQYLKAKIAIDKKDLEYIKNLEENNNGLKVVESSDEWSYNKWKAIESSDEWSYLPNISKRYSWWNLLSIDETVISYERFKPRVYIKSIIGMGLFITEETDGQYYLYAIYS